MLNGWDESSFPMHTLKFNRMSKNGFPNSRLVPCYLHLETDSAFIVTTFRKVPVDVWVDEMVASKSPCEVLKEVHSSPVVLRGKQFMLDRWPLLEKLYTNEP